MSGKIALSVIAVGGNNEVALAEGHAASLPQGEIGHTLREMTGDGPNGGTLGKMLRDHFPHGAAADAAVECTYYSWTGTPREDTRSAFATPIRNLSGETMIFDVEAIKRRTGALVIVGWSNGGATAFELAKLFGARGIAVELLITLDPVSRLTSLHWIPFNGTFKKPDGVVTWLHSYPTSWGPSRLRAETGEEAGSILSLKELWFRARHAFHEMPQPWKWLDPRTPESGNTIAFIGGAWDSQTEALENIAIPGNHSSTREMLIALLNSPGYKSFAQRLQVRATVGGP